MKICIVGGTGNISTSLTRELLAAGHTVTCFTRGESGDVPTGARHLRGDRKDRETFEATMRREKFDAAIDMICFTSEDARSDIRAFRGVDHFIQISTVCTYGVSYDWLPVSEDHPRRPISDYGRNKCAADDAFMAAHFADGFPVTIVKPSTTYGPKMGLLRQIAWEFSWINRVRAGEPILICGDGRAVHQFLHVDDAARGIAPIIGRHACLGQSYNLVRRGFTSWHDHHRTAMQVIGREVELVSISMADLAPLQIPAHDICTTIFAHNCYYSNDRLLRDVPEFQPRVSLAKGMAQVLEAMDADGRLEGLENDWESAAIAKVRAMRGG